MTTVRFDKLLFLCTLAVLKAALVQKAFADCACNRNGDAVQTFAPNTNANRKALEAKAKENCVAEECGEGQMCPDDFAKRCLDFSNTTTELGQFLSFTCKRAAPEACKTVEPKQKTALGHGDPHFEGFNGKHWDFHGKGGQIYLIFGISGIEMLTSRMRASRKKIHGVRLTYFDQFGLRTRDGTRLLVKLCPSGRGRWTAKIRKNGKLIKSARRIKEKSFSIRTRNHGKEIIVRTNFMQYKFRLKHPRSNKGHYLDLDLKILRYASSTSEYLGVIGCTLDYGSINEALGIHQHHWTFKQREQELRKHFHANSMFPSKFGKYFTMKNMAAQYTKSLETSKGYNAELSF